MASLFEAALAMIKPSDVSAGSEWEGSVQSNLEQIPDGDLYVDENEYYEEGGTVRVVSTSQLEAIHSKLHKLVSSPLK
ncbi:hypothetical protein F442_12168 [Phytophthora nicotianae P10297]|uniref:Uncharacterized protein n=1 Tax=Phytophthora nicotianae P10297 TaxID=1317064 RepID=W2Z2Q1_PHYNI|nr:hypothetical protein F442_12168 [Phytophthora nicotianae P10297]